MYRGMTNCSPLCCLARDRAVCRGKVLEHVSHQMEADTIVRNQNMVVSAMAQVAVVQGTDSLTLMPTLTLTLTQMVDMDSVRVQEPADPDTYLSKV